MPAPGDRERPWGKVLVVMPTYNEIDSLERVATTLLEQVPGVDLLIVDDGSPDGTAALAERLAATESRIHVLHGERKGGLGRAYLRGFGWAATEGYQSVVEMDADGSHPAETLPAMLDALQENPKAGLVIGSRWVSGGSVVNWPLRRLLLSRVANLYTRLALGIPIADITAGFRVYPIDVAQRFVSQVDSRGYSFQVEMAMNVYDADLDVVEIPIQFREREAGVSKMSGTIVGEAMSRVFRWGVERRSRGWGGALLGGFALWLISRVVVSLVAIASRSAHGLTAIPSTGFYGLLYQWDSAYYGAIAQYGYFSHSSARSWQAFFPGYPLLSRGVALLIEPGHPDSAAIITGMWIVAAVASLCGAIVIWRLVQVRFGRRVAAAATLVTVFGPYALFFAASYSESLFLVLALLAWFFGWRRRWLAAGLFAALAGVVRPNGIFLAAAIVVMYLVDAHRSALKIRARSVLAGCVGFLGPLAYLAYLYVNTGSIVEWTRAQGNWGRNLEWPWVTFYETAGRVLYASTLDRRIEFGLDIMFAGILVVALVLFVRRRAWAEVTYLGLTALSLMTSFTYMSLARNTALLFPIAIAIARTVQVPGRRRVFVAWASVGFALFLFTTWQFAAALWAD